MKVKELIKQLEQIQDKDVEVFVLNQFDGFSAVDGIEPFSKCVAIDADIRHDYSYNDPRYEKAKWGGYVVDEEKVYVSPSNKFSDVKNILEVWAEEDHCKEIVIGKALDIHQPTICVEDILNTEVKAHEKKYGKTDYLQYVTLDQEQELEEMLKRGFLEWQMMNYLGSPKYNLIDEKKYKYSRNTEEFDEVNE